jgi:hypothetical protein
LQLIQRFNIDPSRMVVRSHRVGKLIKDGSTMYQVVCIAARRDAVMKYIELANRCKLEVVGMHSEPIAIVRAHPLLAGKETGSGTTCYIDIGAGMTKLIVAHGQELAFAKTVHACGNQLTRHASCGPATPRWASARATPPSARSARLRQTIPPLTNKPPPPTAAQKGSMKPVTRSNHSSTNCGFRCATTTTSSRTGRSSS